MAETRRDLPPSQSAEVPKGPPVAGSKTEVPKGPPVAGSKTEVPKVIVKDGNGNAPHRTIGPDIEQAAQALKHAGEELHGNVVAPYIDRTAEKLEHLSTFLRTKSARDIVRETERFARREPLLFLGGAFGLGILCARFLKSSARNGEPPTLIRSGAATSQREPQ